MNKLDIHSDKESYELIFNVKKKNLDWIFKDTKAIVIDRVVWELYKNELNIEQSKLIFVDCVEEKKNQMRL